ncbi:chemoreceptor glutamine deamidase CheD [Paludibacterium yongneupense]|uniref:chemoreceptor glutamine deamidase CheD n=1 Tax=Paludibacterium yongneupense TaxID=400061 RepID=UPI000413DEFC|nr:chemoreceptor glutamine deamidase CheD [Paludibacterium yongneupense]
MNYYDKHFQLPAVKLLPGDYVAIANPLLMVTVLGSCVAACLRDPVSGVCGMNHFMLPGLNADADGHRAERFGIFAMEHLITRMQKLGALRERMQAKVFGGASVLDGIQLAQVGDSNCRFVRSFLDTEGIPIVAEDLYGEVPRKVYFFTDTGKVMIRRLRSDRLRKLEETEREYRERMAKDAAEAGGTIELFR